MGYITMKIVVMKMDVLHHVMTSVRKLFDKIEELEAFTG